MEKAEEFDEWWKRCHPWDWYARENGWPVPTAARLHVWALCRAAWLHEEIPQRSEESKD